MSSHTTLFQSDLSTEIPFPEEFAERVRALFAAIDVDGDGTIDPEEMKRQHGGAWCCI